MSFYDSDKWRKFRQVVINSRLNKQGETICEYCHKPIVQKYDIILHHIKELDELTYDDANISLNPDNIMIVHHACHNKIHNNFDGVGQRKCYIVYGSPRSGKTEFVKKRAGYGDLILDIDSIWECISGQDRYIKPNGLKNIVFAIRDTIMDSIRHKQGYWHNCYLIGGYKLQAERERLATELNAELVYIDTDKATCLKRAEKMPNKEKYKIWIEEWFELNPPPVG